MSRSRRPLLAAALCASLTGCVTPWNTRMPEWHMSSVDWQRREYAQQDPFPDADSGPDTGVRPRGFNQQRSDAIRAKDTYFNTLIRRQHAPAPAPYNGNPGAQYPEAVQVQ